MCASSNSSSGSNETHMLLRVADWPGDWSLNGLVLVAVPPPLLTTPALAYLPPPALLLRAIAGARQLQVGITLAVRSHSYGIIYLHLHI